MSSLGITLLILVFVCIGGVIGYNAWLARREGKELKSLLTESEPMVDLNRSEPSLAQAEAELQAQAASPSDVSPHQSKVQGQALPFFESSDASDQRQEIEPSIDDLPRDVMSGAPVQNPTTPDLLSSQSVPDSGESAPIGTQEMPPAVPAWAADSDHTADTGDPADDQSLAPQEQAPVAGETAELAPEPGPESEHEPDPERDAAAAAAFAAEPQDSENRFDCVVRLAALPSVSGSRLRQLTSDFARVGAKPVIVAGVNAQSEQVEPLVANHEYSSLVFALLLVNRSGAVNPMEYSEFANKIQAIADELDVLADVPDMNDVLTRARELDEELATLDAQVAVNVETAEVLSPGNLLLVSKRLNLTEQGNNRFVRTGEDRQPVFSLSLGDKANRLVLLLDVPRVGAKSQPIREMVECAWHCCQAFEGKMVDDSGRPIDNDLFERIERQLATHYQALETAGVPAGSEQARRVFN